MALYITRCNLLTKVVAICTVTINNTTENTTPCKREGKKFFTAKATVFHKHKLSFCSLLHFDELSAFFFAVCSADFHRNGNTALECINRNIYMLFPARCHKNRIRLFFFKHFNVVSIFSRTKSCALLNFGAKTFCFIFIRIASGNYLCTRSLWYSIFCQKYSTVTCAANCESDFLHVIFLSNLYT